MLLKNPEALPPGEGPLAIDTEFHTENCYWPRLHLIQVRAEDGPVQLIDPHDKELLDAVAPKLLARPWIVHSGSHDLPILQRALGGVPDVVYDTQIAAGLVTTTYPASLRALLDTWCDVQLDKGETLSDWSRRPLSAAQIRYAALDVLHLHDLWSALWTKAEDLDRGDTVLNACAAERDRAISGPDAGSLWTRIPGAHGLEGVASSVLQELAIWRVEVAQSIDRPAHSVLGNRFLLDLSKRRPRNLETLLHGRRAPKKTLRSHAPALLAAIQRASQRPDFAHLSPLRPGSHTYARLSWWSAYAEIEAMKNEWAARLVLPQEDLRTLARENALPETWRSALTEPNLSAAIAGGRTLCLPSNLKTGS